MKSKGIISNLFNRLGFVTIGKLLAFITVPIVSRALGPEQYGIYNFVFAIAGYAFLPANWGFLAKGLRDVSKSPNDGWKVVEKIFSARFTLWLAGCIVTMLICLSIFNFSRLNLYIFLAILTNLGVAISIDFYFYGKKNTFIPSLSNLLGQFIFLGLVWFFVKTKEDLFILMIFNIIYRLFEAIFMLIIYNRENKIQFSFPSKQSIPLLKENFYLGFGSKASFFQSSYPLLIIPLFLTNHDLGIFSATFKLFLIVSLLVQSINLVFSPWIVESKTKPPSERKSLFNKLLLGYSFIGLFLAFLFYFTGPFLIKILFGEEFVDAQKLILVFALILTPIWPVYLLLANYMNNFEKDRYFFMGSLILILLTAISLPLFLYYYNLNGVIYGLGFSILTVIFYYGSKINKELNFK